MLPVRTVSMVPDDGIELSGMQSNPDGLEALLGADGGLDFGALMEQAGAMQAQMLAAQEEMAKQTVEGAAGGGAVRIEVTGGFEFQTVTIDPSAVDPDDVELLQDLVAAAVNEAIRAAQELSSTRMGEITGGMNIPGLM